MSYEFPWDVIIGLGACFGLAVVGIVGSMWLARKESTRREEEEEI